MDLHSINLLQVAFAPDKYVEMLELHAKAVNSWGEHSEEVEWLFGEEAWRPYMPSWIFLLFVQCCLFQSQHESGLNDCGCKGCSEGSPVTNWTLASLDSYWIHRHALVSTRNEWREKVTSKSRSILPSLLLHLQWRSPWDFGPGMVLQPQFIYLMGPSLAMIRYTMT